MHVFDGNDAENFQMVYSDSSDINYMRWTDGSEIWRIPDCGFHRTDGPAVIEFSHGSTRQRVGPFIEYYINGANITHLVNIWLETEHIPVTRRGEFKHHSDVLLFQMRFA